MPLYEYHCPSCALTFEALVALRAARSSRSCPQCARRAPRISSGFAITAGGNGAEPASAAGAAAKPKGPPICMRYPQIPLLCHMDQPSAERFVAKVQGRGAQYDDAVGAREQLRKKRGEPPPAEAKPAAHDDHHHHHHHSHAGKKAHSHRHGRHSH